AVRISGGEFRGRVLSVPKGLDVRPTQDRVREALFNILMHDIAGARFLDLFAGSGAVGLEALSRGASSATFVEQNARHVAFIRANAAMLKVSPEILSADAYLYISSFSGTPFDIVYADPPYALGEERGFSEMLKTLADRNAVRPGGLFIAETTSRQSLAEVPGWDLCRDREYGKTRLLIWKRQTLS
ncbi:MAG: 16S rRNA (guanine(966)-N(2))-methyltransferase RsmD, partial [Kiritimatiellae bacterium]|nr:16S rRNA (guanine(966)-N(2))-methyltransferase RsmD [Kiritimatiellia bacterium]